MVGECETLIVYYREQFKSVNSFSVGAIVPSIFADLSISEKVDMVLLDDCGAVIPWPLLEKIVMKHVHRPGFYLKIEFKTKGDGNVLNMVCFISNYIFELILSSWVMV